MPEPLVTVLMPAFDAAATLGLALTSVQRQRETRWECLVVDDGSRDGTCAVVRELSARDPRIRLLALPHQGIVAALNAGLAEARGRFIARMDADDVMHRQRLALQLRALDEDPALCGVGCHVRLFPRANMSDGLRRYERWLNSIRSGDDVAREAFIECPLAHPTLLFRAEGLMATPYRDCSWPEDYDLVLRLLARGQRLGVVPRRLLHWRDGAGRLSRSSPSYGLPAFVECKAEFLASGFLRARPDYTLWGFGDTGKALCQALARRGKHPSAIVELHPGRLGQLIRGVRVISPEALPSLPPAPLLVSVAGLTPRSEIRAALQQMGFVESRDYVVTA